MKVVEKFLKKQFVLFKEKPLLLMGILLVVLFLVYKPKIPIIPTIEGAENEEEDDSPWYCFLNIGGILDDYCGGGEEEEEEDINTTCYFRRFW